MPIVNRDYMKLVLGLYVYVNSTLLSIVEILTTALKYPNHTGPKSKIVPSRSAQTSWSVLHRVRCGGVISHLYWGVRPPDQRPVLTETTDQIVGCVVSQVPLVLIMSTHEGMARLSWPVWLTRKRDGLPAVSVLTVLIEPNVLSLVPGHHHWYLTSSFPVYQQSSTTIKGQGHMSPKYNYFFVSPWMKLPILTL